MAYRDAFTVELRVDMDLREVIIERFEFGRGDERLGVLVSGLLREHFEKEKAEEAEKSRKPDLRLRKHPACPTLWIGFGVKDDALLAAIWGSLCVPIGLEEFLIEKASAYQEGICIEWLG